MVRHIVIFTWRDGVSGEQVEALRQALDTMASELKDLVVILHGPDLRFRDGNGDYALVATFADKVNWDAYQAHPVHKAFVRDCVTPLLASRQTIQF
jgi:Stress responsive A/B Barrel Domain